jgi:hypothetical protein
MFFLPSDDIQRTDARGRRVRRLDEARGAQHRLALGHVDLGAGGGMPAAVTLRSRARWPPLVASSRATASSETVSTTRGGGGTINLITL